MTYLLLINVEILQFREEPEDDAVDRVVALEHEEHHEEQINHREPKEDAPHRRMRSREGPIRECQDGDDEKEKHHAEHPRPNVLLQVILVPKQKKNDCVIKRVLRLVTHTKKSN